tara:strand:+ start:90 stop:371 length:282 start_codon:yes stop_codon:yes gene_type:complete
MKTKDDFRFFINSFFKREEPKKRKLKRVFQWRRYLEWKDLTFEEKISAKRLFLVPIVAFLLIDIFNRNLLLIVLFLLGYLIYKKFENNGLAKK